MSDGDRERREREERERLERQIREAEAERRRRELDRKGEPTAGEDNDDWDPRRPEQRERPE